MQGGDMNTASGSGATGVGGGGGGLSGGMAGSGSRAAGRGSMMLAPSSSRSRVGASSEVGQIRPDVVLQDAFNFLVEECSTHFKTQSDLDVYMSHLQSVAEQRRDFSNSRRQCERDVKDEAERVKEVEKSTEQMNKICDWIDERMREHAKSDKELAARMAQQDAKFKELMEARKKEKEKQERLLEAIEDRKKKQKMKAETFHRNMQELRKTMDRAEAEMERAAKAMKKNALLKSAIHAQDERIRVARALLDEERAEKDAALAEERRAKEEVAAIEMAQQKLMYEVAANTGLTAPSYGELIPKLENLAKSFEMKSAQMKNEMAQLDAKLEEEEGKKAQQDADVAELREQIKEHEAAIERARAAPMPIVKSLADHGINSASLQALQAQVRELRLGVEHARKELEARKNAALAETQHKLLGPYLENGQRLEEDMKKMEAELEHAREEQKQLLGEFASVSDLNLELDRTRIEHTRARDQLQATHQKVARAKEIIGARPGATKKTVMRLKQKFKEKVEDHGVSEARWRVTEKPSSTPHTARASSRNLARTEEVMTPTTTPSDQASEPKQMKRHLSHSSQHSPIRLTHEPPQRSQAIAGSDARARGSGMHMNTQTGPAPSAAHVHAQSQGPRQTSLTASQPTPTSTSAPTRAKSGSRKNKSRRQ